MPQTPGVADHAVPSNGWRDWVARARKAVIAFVASGALAGLAPAVTKMDWHALTWASLWDGLGSGFVAAVAVYVIRNRAPKLGIDPALEKLIEAMVEQKLHAKILRTSADRQTERRPTVR